MKQENFWKTGFPDGLERHFTDFCRYLEAVNDGTLDLPGLLASPYGEELGRRLALRCSLQQDEKAAREYYYSLGLALEFHQPEDYYGRWKFIYPLNAASDQRYPLVIWNHGGGNSIESEEIMTGYVQLAAKAQYFLLLAQNTNPENILQIIDKISTCHPIDQSRIYVTGFSQGANQGHSLYTHHPDRIAAAALTCIDIFRPWDNFDNRYTESELEKLRKSPVPLSLQVGACEPFAYAPLNHWRPHRMHHTPPDQRGCPDDFEHPGKIDDLDPTRITEPGKGRYDPNNPRAARMTSAYAPSENENPQAWSIRRVNVRLDLLGCPILDEKRCMDYYFDQMDAFHHTVGIYGDVEETKYLYGVRHDMVQIYNHQGLPVFQYVVTDNSPHWPPITSAEIGWAFLKQFKKID